jgi:hypothetical protein
MKTAMPKDDVEQFWGDNAKRRAFRDGFEAQQNCAQNPYTDHDMRAAWDEGNKWKPEQVAQ